MSPALMAGESVDARRDAHPSGQPGAIRRTGFERLLAVDFAIAGERSPGCLLLGIAAHDRVARFEQRVDDMGQMAAWDAAMWRVAAGPYREPLAPGKTEPSEQPPDEAGSSPDGVFLPAFGNLLRGQSRPPHLLAHGLTGGPVLDRVWSLLEHVRLCDCRLVASAPGLSDTTARWIIGPLLALPHAIWDGLRSASQHLGKGAAATMPQCERCEGCKTAAVLF
jgi:hypothetical protein